LNNDKDLQRIGVKVVVQNPKAIHRFKDMFDENKTDRIANFLRFERYNKTII
jgi:transposase